MSKYGKLLILSVIAVLVEVPGLVANSVRTVRIAPSRAGPRRVRIRRAEALCRGTFRRR